MFKQSPPPVINDNGGLHLVMPAHSKEIAQLTQGVPHEVVTLFHHAARGSHYFLGQGTLRLNLKNRSEERQLMRFSQAGVLDCDS